MAATSLFISNSCSPHLFSQRKQTLSSKSYLHGCPTSIPLSSSSTCFTTHKLHYCYAPKTSSLKSYNFTKILAPPVKGVESSILQSSQDEEPSAAAIVDSFYAAINRKDFTLLSNLLAEDCILHRTLFSEPFEGKERVMKLIRDSVDPMDSETRFVIDETIEGTPNKVGKIWHLEQKRADFIFDRGFSFHSCKSYQGKLLISDIEVFINSIQLDILYSAINETFAEAFIKKIEGPVILIRAVKQASMKALKEVMEASTKVLKEVMKVFPSLPTKMETKNKQLAPKYQFLFGLTFSMLLLCSLLLLL